MASKPIVWLLLAALAAAFLCVLSMEQTHLIYGIPGLTRNGGIHLPGTQCGFEVWGTPGPFCGDY